MRQQVTYVVGIVVVSIAGLIYTFAAGNEPLLGLDLQGGASVVLEPEPLPDGQEITEESLDQAVDIIRNRVDGLGVREPEVTRQGETILVQIPGVDDQQRAIDLVGQTAELRFRPVLQRATLDDQAEYEAALAVVEAGEAEADVLAGAQAVVDRWTLTPDAGTDEISVLQDRGNQTFLGRIRMGPVPEVIEPDFTGQRFTGEGVESAAARFNVQSGWGVNPVFQPGSPGIDDFNALAVQCNTFSGQCPAGQIAIEIERQRPVLRARPDHHLGQLHRGGGEGSRPRAQLRCAAARAHRAGEPHRQLDPR